MKSKQKHDGSVIIVGASPDPSRYSHRALVSLKSHGYKPVLMNPNYSTIEHQACFKTLEDAVDATGPCKTVTMYVSPKISSTMVKSFLAIKPHRVIFNPGSENSELQTALEREGIRCIEACTLVLLSTGQYEAA